MPRETPKSKLESSSPIRIQLGVPMLSRILSGWEPGFRAATPPRPASLLPSRQILFGKRCTRRVRRPSSLSAMESHARSRVRRRWTRVSVAVAVILATNELPVSSRNRRRLFRSFRGCRGLRSLNPARYGEVATLLARLLPEGTSFRGREGREDYLFHHRGLDVQFDALSDGFRAYIGWIGDLLYHMCLCCPDGEKLVDHRGIVMIDEVDLHLHPEWQLVVLPTISQALPKLQFLCTTHSPIVAGTVESANLHLVLPDGEIASVLTRPEVEVHGLTADQILQSSHFGLVSTRAPDFYRELQEVSRAVSRGEPGAAGRFMEMTSLGAGAAGPNGRQATR